MIWRSSNFFKLFPTTYVVFDVVPDSLIVIVTVDCSRYIHLFRHFFLNNRRVRDIVLTWEHIHTTVPSMLTT